jgi:hypothetical protein
MKQRESQAVLQVRKIRAAMHKGLLHGSCFDLAELAHPGIPTALDAPYKVKRRAMLCLMVDVAVDWTLKHGGMFTKDIEELQRIKDMDK